MADEPAGITGIANTILSALGGGATVAAVLTYFTGRKKQESEDSAYRAKSIAEANQVLLANLTARIVTVEKRSDECDERADKLREENQKCHEAHAEQQRKTAELEAAVQRLQITKANT